MVAGCGGIWVRRWMEGYGYGCAYGSSVGLWGILSQLEWFSNAPNALVIAAMAPFASCAVQRAYVHLPRFPWSPHWCLRCARSLRRVCVSHVGDVFACVPNAAPRGVCVPNALPRRVRVQNTQKKWGALGACHAVNALNVRIFLSRFSSTHTSATWTSPTWILPVRSWPSHKPSQTPLMPPCR
jgi:hypothetical protein